MKKSLIKPVFFAICCFFTTLNSSAQVKLSIYNYEDSLQQLGTTITNDTLENHRISANASFIKTLVSALKEKNSFSFPFQKLHGSISIKTSDDKKFRIFTWFVFKDDGTYRYYGAIQMNSENLQLIPLLDGSDNLKNFNLTQTLAPKEWLGAVYYDIIPVAGKNPYYMLLGWKGNSFESTKKVIEILSFKNNEAVFGMPMIESGPKSGEFGYRKVFSYGSGASMLLRYLKDEKLFVFDHLVPPSENFEGSPDLYAPDLTYDAYRYKNGKWFYQENIKLKNLPSVSDDLLVDPSKITPSTIPIRQY